MANLDRDVPLTPAAIFRRLGVEAVHGRGDSPSRAGRQIVDRRRVRKHIPELPDFGRKITIRHLANHTSGIRDQWSLLGLAGWRYSRDLITDDDVLELLGRQKDLNFTPGERHAYSNSGYTLMAVIVSRVSGQSFSAFTTERIFKPLGMLNTHFRDNFGEIVKNQAYGYAAERGTFRLSVTNFDTAGATSLLTTVEDMARWHANFDRHTVGGERLQAGLLDRGVLNDGRRIDYAFGISHGMYRGLPTVGHGGSDAGYRAAFLRFPEQRFGVATLCNLATTNPTELSQRVADIYLADKLRPQTSPPANDGPEVALPAAQLATYSGLYWNEAAAAARRIVVEKGQLHAAFGRDRVALKSLGGGRFVLTAGGRMGVTFETDRPGATPRLRMGPEPTDVFERVEPFVPSARNWKSSAAFIAAMKWMLCSDSS
jgi:CubicO group peptidase (beta-lactamase class C family)